MINVWHDGDISAGTEWEQEIKEYLNKAHIILLLISPDFINSDYCYDTEMKRALERHERNEATVILVIVRPVTWQGTLVGNSKLGRLQALPKNAKPITTWENRDEAWENVTKEIEKVANKLLGKSSTNQSIASWDPPPPPPGVRPPLPRPPSPRLTALLVALVVLLLFGVGAIVIIVAPGLTGSPTGSQLKSFYRGTAQCTFGCSANDDFELIIMPQAQQGHIKADWIYTSPGRSNNTYHCTGTVTGDNIKLNCTAVNFQDYKATIQGSILPNGQLEGTFLATSDINPTVVKRSWTASA